MPIRLARNLAAASLIWGAGAGVAEVEIRRAYDISYGPFRILDTACIAALQKTVLEDFGELEAVELPFPVIYNSQDATLYVTLYAGAVFQSGGVSTAPSGAIVCLVQKESGKVSDLIVQFGPPGLRGGADGRTYSSIGRSVKD